MGENNFKQDVIFYIYIHKHTCTKHALIYMHKSHHTYVPAPATHTHTPSLIYDSCVQVDHSSREMLGTADVSDAESFPPSLHVIKVVVGTSDSPISVAEYE